MPKQHGPNPLSGGSIGNITYVNHPQHGFIARERGGPDKEQMETNPNYAVVRRNYNIFGDTSRSCSLIREGFAPLIASVGDRRICDRLMSPGRDIFAHGLLSGKGHPFHTELIRSLKGFRFNQRVNVYLQMTCHANVEVKEDEIILTIPGTTQELITNISHFRLVSSLASFDFEAKDVTRSDVASEFVESDATAGFRFRHEIPTGYPVHMLALTVMFYTRVSDTYYRLGDKKYCGGEVVAVEVVHR